MPSGSGARGSDGWLSASDLADYAYCPRSFWYRRHPPAEGASPGAERARELGSRYHEVTLRAAERAGRSRRLAWVALGVAAVLVGLGLVGVLAL